MFAHAKGLSYLCALGCRTEPAELSLQPYPFDFAYGLHVLFTAFFCDDLRLVKKLVAMQVALSSFNTLFLVRRNTKRAQDLHVLIRCTCMVYMMTYLTLAHSFRYGLMDDSDEDEEGNNAVQRVPAIKAKECRPPADVPQQKQKAAHGYGYMDNDDEDMADDDDASDQTGGCSACSACCWAPLLSVAS